jgi:Kef-type K+ transport system membrane component KefB
MDLLLTNLMGVFVLAVVTGIIFKFIGLPSIIGQVVVGLGIGISGIINADTVSVMHILGSFGITLLLFLVGLEMNWQEIQKVGKTVFFLFFGQTVMFGAIFYLISYYLLHLTTLSSVMVAIGLSFSSTIVVVKVLSEKKDLDSFSGKLSLGILLLQDILAIMVLVFLPSIGRSFDLMGLLILVVKLLVMVLLVNVVGHVLISKILKAVVKSGEDLILFSLAWFMVVVFLATKGLGLTAEIGAFLAGLSLSTSWGHFQINNKIKSFRDVFLTIFFVLLGLQIGPGNINWLDILVLCLLVVIVKFVLSFMWSRLIGLNKRISFLVSLNMTQVSEFSLVVMSIGLGMNLWDSELVKVITIVGLITMSLSSVLINLNSVIYKRLLILFPNFFKQDKQISSVGANLKNHIVLFGADRTGRGIVNYLLKRKEKFIVVDFNPEVVNKLMNRGVEAIFADAADPDIFDMVNMSEAKMIISTIKDVEDSLALLDEAKKRKISIPIIVDAEGPGESKRLYDAGASYVLFPHFVSGWHINQLLIKHKTDKNTFKKYRSKQDESLKSIYEGEY